MISISWKNDSDLIVGGIGKIVAATVTGLIKAQCYLALLLWRHVSGELMGLLVHQNSGMRTVEHVLKGDQCLMIELGIPCIG